MGAANDNPFNPNLSMLCDYYELTMGNAYFANGMHNQTTYFDLYFRELPDGGGYAIAAGLEQAVEYLSNLSFTPEDIEFLRGKGQFRKAFWSICATSVSAATFGPCRRARRCSPTSLW